MEKPLLLNIIMSLIYFLKNVVLYGKNLYAVSIWIIRFTHIFSSSWKFSELELPLLAIKDSDRSHVNKPIKDNYISCLLTRVGEKDFCDISYQKRCYFFIMQQCNIPSNASSFCHHCKIKIMMVTLLMIPKIKVVFPPEEDTNYIIKLK